MPALTNKKHEVFAQAVADGMSGAAAYRKHVSKGKCIDATAEVAASRLLSEGSKVALRVQELRDAANRIIEQKLSFTKQDAMQYLVDVIQTPIGTIDASSRLCQERTYIEGREQISVKVKMPGKLEALKQLAVMCGWNAPEQHDVNLIGPRGVLAGIIKRK